MCLHRIHAGPQRLDMLVFHLLLAILCGSIATLSRLVNSALASFVGTLSGSFINHVVGTFFAGLLLCIGLGQGSLQFTGIPLYFFIGGILGVFAVTFNNYAIPFIGVASMTILMLFAQLLSSSFIDHFGLLGAQIVPLTFLKLIGLCMLFMGAFLVVRGKSNVR
jgi:bacterial/archaeal transporter family-2 protein